MIVIAKRPRLSMGGMMAVILIVAVDGAVLREMAVTGNLFAMPALGVLPMASLLIFGIANLAGGLVRRSEGSPFLFGFEVFGWLAIGCFVACVALRPGWLDTYAVTMFSPLSRAFGGGSPLAAFGSPFSFEVQVSVWTSAMSPPKTAFEDIVWHSGVALVLSIPQLLFALSGGWLFRRLNLRIVRGPRTRIHTEPASAPEP